MPETSFESKFGQMVDSKLSESMPSLIKYRIGFQVVDKTEDEKRAVGIYAFIINNVWVYMPVFFIDGAIKMVHLFLKQSDTFVPARDNWVSMIREQGTGALGGAVDRHDKKLDMAAAPENVNIMDVRDTTTEKFASANSLIDFPTLMKMASTADRFQWDFFDMIEKLGADATAIFANTIATSPEFANALFHFYKPQDLNKVASFLKEAAESELRNKEKQEGSVNIITNVDDDSAKKLKPEEKKMLVQNGFFVEDKRYNFSKVFHTTIDSKTYQSPTTSGIYEVLMRDGSCRTMVLLLTQNVADDQSRYSRMGSMKPVGKDCALIDLDTPKLYTLRKATDILCKPTDVLAKDGLRALKGGDQGTANTMREGGDSKTYLITQGPDNALEVRVTDVFKTPGGKLAVYICNGYGDYLPSAAMDKPSNLYVEFTDKPGKLSIVGDTLYIPSDVRLFKKLDYDADRQLALGTLGTIYPAMMKTAGLVPATIYSDGNTALVKVANNTTNIITKLDAVKHLVHNVGIEGSQVGSLLKHASRQPGHKADFFIKLAEGYVQQAIGVKKVPAVTEFTKRVGGRSVIPDKIIEQAVHASETGIKEVFDATVIKSLVNAADVSELRKDYVVKLVRGMDSVGRILFLFYWHKDEFSERYGKDELNELEDTLKQVFVSLGDLIIFLKEKVVYAPDSAENLLGTLSEDVGQTAK